tara:strand:+ start:1796 stop:2215 length:420 start_codon:yes stop_codon:yes gene_type:complete
MKEWVIYALIAALFIAVRDVISLDLIKRMNYTNYIIIANIIIFIATMIYLNISNYKVEKPNLKDMGIIVLRLIIVFLIIEPSIFRAFKGSTNPGYAKSIINLNTLFVFLLALIFLKADFTFEKLAGIFIILIGGYLIMK